MAITPVPSMTDIPTFPALSDRASGDYNGMAFKFARHMSDNFVQEIVPVAASVVSNAVEAQGSARLAESAASTASEAATIASAIVGVTSWASGATYALNQAAISKINNQTYRRRVAGAGTTDPANDPTNWAMLIGRGSFLPVDVGAATSINLAAGNYFLKPLAGNQTLTFDNCPQDGYSFTLEVVVTSGVLTLPMTVRLTDNVAYTLTAGKTHLLMFVTSNRGARWRMAALANFDN